MRHMIYGRSHYLVDIGVKTERASLSLTDLTFECYALLLNTYKIKHIQLNFKYLFFV